MTVQTQEEVREIVDFSPEGLVVTSVYLNVDASEFPSDDLLQTSFDSLMHTAESRRKDMEEGLSHDATESLRGDLAKIREFFADGLQRDDTGEIAIFSCSAQNFWQVIHMPMSVGNQVYFGPRPHVSPIATFVSHSKPTAILLTDKQHARIFTMSGSEVREWTDFEDNAPQRTAQRGGSQSNYQRRADQWKQHHIDHAAELVLKLLQHYPFDWLILGTEVQSQATLEQALHPYLKDRVVGEISVRIDADSAEIIEKAEEIREQVESRHIDTLIEQIQEFAGAGGRGAIGLEKTLEALNEQKIHILLLQQGLVHQGSECPNCGMLFADQQKTCVACNEPTRPVDDVIDLAVQKAIELGSTVEVATEFEKLLPIESIGAILYY